jgi:hypothetical protein
MVKWKEADVAQFKVLSGNSPGWTEENKETPQSGLPDYNPGLPEFEARVLIIRPRRAVVIMFV